MAFPGFSDVVPFQTFAPILASLAARRARGPAVAAAPDRAVAAPESCRPESCAPESCRPAPAAAAAERAFAEAGSASPGWLRARSFAAATARYRLADAAAGTLESEVATLLEVENAGRGVLVLADGRALDIVVCRTGAGAAAFTVLGERLDG
ncbi:hypothetical protein [Ancylobacter lacus]|uniref:hypothetical protein n=1 Tax=Ancylobacter lacus TaxID=2579970 RepID=UPI001BCFBDC9|nr:hypothetical protein [Ancylobacter lacus]MBS7540012.1 hypothetical protein [Ancylobacter lacus]